MQRNRLLIYMMIIGLGVACAPRPKVVYVDLTFAMQHPMATQTDVKPVPASLPPRSSQNGEVATLPAQKARTVTFPLTRERLEQARETVRKSEEQAIRDISRKLRSTYMAEIAQLEQEKLRTLDPRHQEQVEAAFAKIRSVFKVYADRRGPVIAEIAFRAGFPDPDPQSLRVPEDDDKRRKARFLKIKALREKLSEIDQDYQKQAQAIIDEIDAQSLKELGNLRVEMEELRAKKEQEAENEARKQVQSVRDRMNSLLIGNPSVTLPALSSVRGSVPASTQQKAVNLSPQLEDNQLNELKSDLQIWLSTHHYVLGESSRAHNATQEFIEWRRRHLGGH